MKAVTYILRCSNGQYYVGSTENLEERMKLHNSGRGGQFTSRHLPFELVYTEEFDSYAEAFRRERQLHGWSHAKKEALITHHPSSFSGLYWFLYLDELGNRLSKDYPNKVVHVAENIQPSARGEYEITRACPERSRRACPERSRRACPELVEGSTSGSCAMVS